MTPPPLSPAAQAVLVAHAKARCQREWSTVTDPPCHPSDPEWNGCGICVDRAGPAAAIRALVEATLPEEQPVRGGMRPGGTQPVTPDEFRQAQRRHTRAQQLAIAAELHGGNTTTETPND
jgi:hypothetical protein